MPHRSPWATVNVMFLKSSVAPNEMPTLETESRVTLSGEKTWRWPHPQAGIGRRVAKRRRKAKRGATSRRLTVAAIADYVLRAGRAVLLQVHQRPHITAARHLPRVTGVSAVMRRVSSSCVSLRSSTGRIPASLSISPTASGIIAGHMKRPTGRRIERGGR